jgi:sugar/nucleoside kinase (ribokinase family)
MPEKKYKVVGVGHAIVDVLANVEDDFLNKYNLKKGMMKLVDESEIKGLRECVDIVKEVSGGSAANTIAALSSLGHPAAFIGKVRDDLPGRTFEKGLEEIGVNYCTIKAGGGKPTGCCVVLTTPDAHRTMNTYLGIAGFLTSEDIDETVISQSEIIYLEGYLWDNEEAKKAFKKAIEIAGDTGGKVALSLSDSFCVERHREEFLHLAENHVDIIFANEEEIKSLFKTDNLETAISRCREMGNIWAITRSEKGSVIVSEDRIIRIPTEPDINVVDSTGAGDLYAAGFLHGLIKGKDLEICGKIGSIAAAEILGHFGARPEVSLIDLVKSRGY